MNSAYSVLVVDDEPSIGKLLLKELTTPARAVHVAASGSEARELLAKTEYEVAVIDIRLQREWEETGIVAGSKLLTFFDAQGRHDAAGWLERVKPLAKPNEAVIVICRTGNRSAWLNDVGQEWRTLRILPDVMLTRLEQLLTLL